MGQVKDKVDVRVSCMCNLLDLERDLMKCQIQEIIFLCQKDSIHTNTQSLECEMSRLRQDTTWLLRPRTHPGHVSSSRLISGADLGKVWWSFPFPPKTVRIYCTVPPTHNTVAPPSPVQITQFNNQTAVMGCEFRTCVCMYAYVRLSLSPTVTVQG